MKYITKLFMMFVVMPIMLTAVPIVAITECYQKCLRPYHIKGDRDRKRRLRLKQRRETYGETVKEEIEHSDMVDAELFLRNLFPEKGKDKK